MHRLLIVEDEENLHGLLRRVLEQPSRELVFATSVRTALAVIDDGGVDIALIDKNLPDGSGTALISLLRDASPDAEVILMTGYASVDSAIEACRLGVFDYLRKPFDDISRVALTVQNACDKIDLLRAQQHLHAELARSERRYALAADATVEGLWEWDLQSGEFFFSERWWAILGERERPGASTAGEWFERVHADDRERLDRAINVHLAGHSERFDCEYRMLHADGSYRLIVNRGLAVRDEHGKPLRIAGQHQDVTARRQTEERLRHDAFHDPLTRLANQALFRERLARALRTAKRRNTVSAVMFLDLDRFKNVNDSLGHVVGDQLLVGIARRLQLCVRASDTFARMGGDEFAILLEGVDDVTAATHLAERIQQELERPFALEGHEVFAGASIGITLSSGQDEPDAVLREADTAMYRAKEHGKGRYEVFDAEMHAAATRLLQLETDLRRALDRHEFRVHYQPIVNLSTGRIAGFEALVRWDSPTRGVVSPTEFIPIAEELGLIVPLGAWVLREACTQMRAWQTGLAACRRLYVTVNVSGKQLTSGSLLAEVQQVLADTGLPPNALKLEITESTLIGNLEAAKVTLHALKEMNIRLCLDDFGTGYSSLSFLHQLPIDTIKINRSFVTRLEASGDGTEFVRTIVTLARALGLDLIAEGVETAEQVAVLSSLGCRFGQGFLYSCGLNAEAALALFPEPWRKPRITIAPAVAVRGDDVTQEMPLAIAMR